MVTVWPQSLRAPKLMNFLTRDAACRPSVSCPGKRGAGDVWLWKSELATCAQPAGGDAHVARQSGAPGDAWLDLNSHMHQVRRLSHLGMGKERPR